MKRSVFHWVLNLGTIKFIFTRPDKGNFILNTKKKYILFSKFIILFPVIISLVIYWNAICIFNRIVKNPLKRIGTR